MKRSLFIILLFAFFGYGCSSITLAYRNADVYLQYKIYAYTAFNAQQKSTIRQAISDYMEWHRGKALPEYIIFLQNLNGAAQSAGQMKSTQVAQLRADLVELYQKTLDRAIRPTVEVLSTLDDSQIQGLADTFAKDIDKQRHDELDISRDEYLDARADKTISFFKWLAGNLSSEQEQQIRNMSRRLPLVNDIYLQQREANQARLIALLKEHAGKEQLATFFFSWLHTPEATRSPQQQRRIEEFEQASNGMVAAIHDLLTDTQKAHIQQRISELIDDMHAEIGKARQ